MSALQINRAKKTPTASNAVGFQSAEKPVIIKSIPLNISPTPPVTLSVPTRR